MQIIGEPASGAYPSVSAFPNAQILKYPPPPSFSMDKFTGIMQEMAKMSPAEVAAKIEKTKRCASVPGVPRTIPAQRKKGESIFCMIGKSSCTLMKTACVCPACPVTDLMGFERQFFCMKGKEKDQRGM